MCGPNGVPTAVQAKRFESTTRFGRYALETHGYVDIDGLQRGFSLPVVVGSGGVDLTLIITTLVVESVIQSELHRRFQEHRKK